MKCSMSQITCAALMKVLRDIFRVGAETRFLFQCHRRVLPTAVGGIDPKDWNYYYYCCAAQAYTTDYSYYCCVLLYNMIAEKK